MLTSVRAPSGVFLRNTLFSIATQLGVPVRAGRSASQICELRPAEAVRARAHSLSGKYSTGSFPCHTDAAHWPIPCRYILLACVNPGAGHRPTLLLDSYAVPLTAWQREVLGSTPFRVKNGRGSFFSTVLQEGRPFIRYDPGCMQPLSARGGQALSYFDSQTWQGLVERITWISGDILIVDNWRILHGRGPSTCDDAARTLLRLYVHKEHL
jgi:hypothetical protein